MLLNIVWYGRIEITHENGIDITWWNWNIIALVYGWLPASPSKEITFIYSPIGGTIVLHTESVQMLTVAM